MRCELRTTNKLKDKYFGLDLKKMSINIIKTKKVQLLINHL